MDFFSLSLYQKNINLCSPQRMHASLYDQIKESLTAAQYLAFETVFMSGACLWWCLWKQLTGFWNIASYATCNETWMSLLKLFVIERMLSLGSGSAVRGSHSSGRLEAVISCRRYRGHWPTQRWTHYSSSSALGERLSCCDESQFLNSTRASRHFISFTFAAAFIHICSPFSLNSLSAIIGNVWGDGLKMAA